MPQNVSNARLEGLTLAYSGAIGSFNLQGSYDYLDAKDVLSGKRLPQRAEHKASVAVGQRLGPWEWRTEVQVHGRRFNDESNLLAMGGYALVNLYAAYHVAPDWSVFARVNNLFDRDYVLIDSYATPGSNFFMGVRYSPK
jgi:vitamin B12 transporter